MVVCRTRTCRILLTGILLGALLLTAQAAADTETTPAEATPNPAPLSPSAPAATSDNSRPVDSLENHSLTRSDSRSSAADSQNPAEYNPVSGALWRSLLSLALVLVLIVLVARLYRRFVLGRKRFHSAAGLEIIARTGVNPKQSLCLIKLGQRLILLGLSPNHIAPLQTIDDPDEVARLLGIFESQSSQSVSNTFAKLIQHESRDYRENDNQNDPSVLIADQDHELYGVKGELTNLLDKVKGLAKLHYRS